jgi:hypothetical protein
MEMTKKNKFVAVAIVAALGLGGSIYGGSSLKAEKDRLADGTEVAAIQQEETPKSMTEIDIQSIAQEAVSKYQKLSNHNEIEVTLDNKKKEKYNLKEDKELRKWIIRNRIDSKMAGVNLAGETLVKDSVNSMKKRNDAFKFAREKYDVKINPADVKKYIEDQMEFYENDDSMGPFFTKLTDGLGISKKEFYFEWEYDNFLNNYTWEKLRPAFEEKYPKKSDEDIMDYQDRIIKAYNNELNAYSSAKGKAKSVKF